jgi:hypothetical protein
MYEEEFKKINEFRAEINSYYINSLTKIGSMYFSETLSELSRKRQNILLICSIVTILVAFAIITPLEGEFGGVKYQFSNITIFKKLAATVTTYFFVVYMISVLRDIRLNYYQNLPAQLEMRQLMDKMKQANLDRRERIERFKEEFDKRMSVRIEEQEDLRKLFDKVQYEYSRQRSELLNLKYDNYQMVNNETHDLLQSEIDMVSQKSFDEIKVFDELGKEMLEKDGVNDLNKLMRAEAYDFSLNKKFNSILEIQKIKKLHNFLSTFVEIVFPLGLAIYAIYVGYI